MAKKSNLLVCFLGISIFLFSRESTFAAQANKDFPYLYEIYINKTITNTKILPRSFPIPGTPGRVLDLTACRGEYEPASFVIQALDQITGLEVTATDLKGQGFSIPGSAIDIRVVKCWFRAGVQLSETNKCILSPELLLKDDKLVKVDLEGKRNFCRTISNSGKESYVLISDPLGGDLKDFQPKDADHLLPVDMDVGSVKQFWITLHVPEEAPPGQYEGKIKLAAANMPPSYLTLQLRVLPFALEKPSLRYSIFYTGQITTLPPEARKRWPGDKPKAVITCSWKSPQQYSVEMKDLKAHGVDYPTLEHYDHQDKTFNEPIIRQMLEIRAKAGLPTDTLYSLGFRIFNPTEPDKIAALSERVQRYLALVKEYGYQNVYVYGIDEAKGDLLKSQRPAWEAVHKAGAKVFVASHTGAFEAMGDLLDLAVHGGWIWQEAAKYKDASQKWGRLIPEEAKKYHQLGHQIFSFGNPQVGMEEPETYRRNYGLLLWKAGYDGAMDYAYQEEFGHIWNDFDDKRYRDHVFAYPTVDGVIDTIQWEGFREGVDDVRYLTTLLKAIKEAKTSKPQLAAEAQVWINRLEPQSDLDMLRSKMIEWILKLQ